jgi:UDP-2-acetamido-2,6-beta-L-arabino-hexul-4-ose reductase
MKTVLVTGASGFIGKNLCAQLEQEADVTILRFEKDDTADDLRKALDQVDFVFHLAGANRPKDETEFDRVNRGLTEDILSMIKESGRKTPILLTSSVQAKLDNPYGRSKKAAEDTITSWAKSTGVPIYIYRLPNVFGKWCRPNYNSVVATFCHNIANNIDITISSPANNLTLVYIDDVVEEFIKALRGKTKTSSDGFCHISRDFTVTLEELAAKIYAFKNSRESLLMPNLENMFDRFLYATYTSYLDKRDFSYQLNTKEDNRGWLAEFIKSEQFGQVFVSRTKPGITRGNHWHHTKIEKFLVVEGEADICFRNLDSTEKLTYKVSGTKPEVIDIPAGYVHAIKNTGTTELITLFWADEIFNPARPDTHYMEV